MKIVKLLFIFIMLFSFIACTKDEEIVPPLTCGENQKEENGKCVIIDQSLEDIKLALEATKELTNYQIDVLVKHSEQTIVYSYHMILRFDENLALFEMEDEMIYYEYIGNSINEYTKQGDAFALDTVDKINGHGFYKSMEPTWFTKMDEYYLLGSQYLSIVNALIQTDFPDGHINNFKVGLGREYLDYFMFGMMLGEKTYTLTFTFSLFDQVSLELPTV